MTDYTKLTVAKLKVELEKRDLATTGKKANLVARLEENDAESSSSAKADAPPAAAAAAAAEAEDEGGVEKAAEEEDKSEPSAAAPIVDAAAALFVVGCTSAFSLLAMRVQDRPVLLLPAAAADPRA